MRGRTAALGLAAVLTMTLTSCGVRSEADRGTDTDRLRSGQTEQDLIRSGRTMLKDGSYYAGTDGEVDRVRPERDVYKRQAWRCASVSSGLKFQETI